MLRRGQTDSGLMVLGTVLVLGQLVLLLLVMIKVVDAIPRLDPIQVVTSRSNSVIDRRDRTVQLPPAKVAPDETTDHVP